MARLAIPSAALLALATMLADPAVATAQCTVSTIDITLQLKEADGTFRDMTVDEQREFFNASRCVCGASVGLEFRLTPAMTSPPNETVEVYAGTECDDLTNVSERDARCEELDSFPVENITTIEVDSSRIMLPKKTCGPVDETRAVWALVRNESSATSYDCINTLDDISIDTELPPAPTDVLAQGAEDSAVITWTPPETNSEDIRSYQVLCANSVTGEPVFAQPKAPPEYVTPIMVCGEDLPLPDDEATALPDAGVVDREDAAPVDASPADASLIDAQPAIDAGPAIDATPAADASPTTVTGTLANLDPRYVCTGELAPSAASARVDLSGVVLGEDESVELVLVVIDDHRNPRAVTGLDLVNPRPVRDFWEVYDESGGTGKGGFCGIALGGNGLGIALGLLFLAAVPLAVLHLRRRRRRVPPALVLLLAGSLLAAGRPAAAQPILTDEAEEAPSIVRSAWLFELKFGPYTPGIDDDIATRPGPYERTFGAGDSLLSQIEFDRFFLWPGGQLGVGLSAGYLTNSAAAFVQGEDGTATDERSPADETSFNMVPLSLSAVYRFTALADHTVVPLVPYGKVGLSYYIWWITKGDGTVSSTPSDGKARGGTPGWQASLGLALRADAFDPGAARALELEGIEHAGFFIEGTYADVSWNEKLPVGDLTWFAGINFEF